MPVLITLLRSKFVLSLACQSCAFIYCEEILIANLSESCLPQRMATSVYGEAERCLPSTCITPPRTCALKPWYLNGFLLLISKVPFMPPDPYNADDAPESNSMLSTSRSVKPIMLPTEKFKPGAWLSIPSTSWLKRRLPLPLNPRVLGVLNVKLEVTISTPFRFAMTS